jgi:hypothetical protein
MDIHPEAVEDKLLEPTGNSVLDEIRTFTFLSLNDSSPASSRLGIRRAIQILYSAGMGYFITHTFSFSDEWIKSITSDDDSIEGKSLASIMSGNSAAYERFYREYKKLYSKMAHYDEDYIKLSNISTCTPLIALPLLRLLMLIIISTKFEG